MKNKIIIHAGVILFYCLCVVVAADLNNLKIFRNVDGFLVELPSKIEVPSGANLTLICRAENRKQKVESRNGYVAWFIPPKKPFKSNLNDFRKSSNLDLRNVNVNDEGFYICANLKFQIYKILYLAVKKQNGILEPDYLKILRQKRDVVYGHYPNDFNSTDTRTYEEREAYQNSFPSFQDILEETDRVNQLAKEENNYNNGRNDIYDSNNNYDVNRHEDSDSHSFPYKPFAAVFGCLFIAFVVFLLLRLCGYRKRSSSINRNNRQQNIQNSAITAPRVNTSGHPSSSSNYLLNPEAAYGFHANTDPTAPILFAPMDIVNPTTQLNLPPTYSSSTHNSTHNLNDAKNELNKKNFDVADGNNVSLPPSYDEAIDHKNDGNNTASHSRNENHHSTSDGFSGNHNSGGGDGGHSKAGGGNY